jgi:hypothetical protein
MNPTTKNLLVRQMVLNLTAHEFEEWHSLMLSAMPPPMAMAESICDLTAQDVIELENIRSKMLTSEELLRFRSLLDDLGTASTRLYAGDRHYVHEARCKVLDAVCLIQRGHLRDASQKMQSVCGRLDWLLNDRQRNGFERKRFIDDSQLPLLKGVLDESKDLLSCLERAAAAL